MNRDVIEGNRKLVRGKVRQRWGTLTSDRLDMVSGRRGPLVGKIQECCGIARGEAERLVTDWEARCGDAFAQAARQREECRREAALIAALDSIGRF